MVRHREKRLFTAVSAAVALGAFVSAASANRLALSNQTFRATWNWEFVDPLGFITLRCPVTIEGSFHSRTISKVLEALIGYVTQGTMTCTGGSARILAEMLPWHIRYAGFTAANGLPVIESIRLRFAGLSFLIQISSLEGMQRCLYKSTAASPFRGVVNRNTTTGEATTLEPETARIPLFNETLNEPTALPCAASTGFRGATTSFTVQNGTTKITVTLVA